jgi:hypothetical protein
MSLPVKVVANTVADDGLAGKARDGKGGLIGGRGPEDGIC